MLINNDINNRYAIFVFYDRDGIVDEYNYVLLHEIKKYVKKMLIICNGDVNENGISGLNQYADEVIVRPNKGFDITAYKLGIFNEKYLELVKYDEVIIFNNTFFGPLYPFSEMFDYMNQKDIDFWGMTEFHEVPFDPFGTIKYGYIPKHIQSYFMVFRKSLVSNKEFIKYWKNIPKIKNYEQAIGYHEAIFTKYFSDLGFKWDVYMNTDDLEDYTYEALRDFPRYLIEKRRCPIMKRRAYFHDYGEALSRSGGEATSDAMDYIESNLDYDEGLIYQNILRLCNQADLKKRLHWNYVLSTKVKNQTDISDIKIAMVLHIYYTELAECCKKYVYSMPRFTDIYITVPNEEKKSVVEMVFSDCEDYNIQIRIVGNLGRDVAPFLVGCKDIINKYDLICKVHDKKVYQVLPMSIGASWQKECFDNLLENDILVHNVISLFKEKPYLGLLTPPVPKHGAYYPTTGKGEWGENYRVAKELADILKLHVNMDETKEPVAPLGSMFWVRTKALKTLFDHDWQYDEFPKEPIATDATVLHAIERIYPFVVQNDGYYPGWLMSDNFATIELTNWNFMNRELDKAIMEKVGYCNYREMISRTKELI